MTKILIVDDDVRWSESVRNNLITISDVELLPNAHSGSEALNSIISNAPDLIILDLILPEYDGLYILNHIHINNPEYNPIIYILTTINTERTQRLIENLGVDYYSVKPINPKVVAENTLTLIKMLKGEPKREKSVDELSSLNLKTCIDDFIYNMGIPIYRKSSKCLYWALYYALEDEQILQSTMRLYGKIMVNEEINLRTQGAVERNVRTAIQMIIKADRPQFHKLFPTYGGKIRNSDFIQQCAYALRRKIGDALSD